MKPGDDVTYILPEEFEDEENTGEIESAAPNPVEPTEPEKPRSIKWGTWVDTQTEINKRQTRKFMMNSYLPEQAPQEYKSWTSHNR